ncbi:MAG TPA: CBS domain-containing protein [Methanoregulaceae archaeon]|nr:CBS domain-containing protein [Methanoregulaceae archaeon]
MRRAQDFLVEIPVLRFNDRLTKARQVLRDDRYREAYITDDRGRLIGYIDITDALRLTATKSDVTVEGFVKDAAEAGREDPVEGIARAMRDAGTDSAAVIDEERRITGGVLLSDIFPVILSCNKLRGLVEDYMTRNVVVAQADDPVPRIHALMLEHGYTAFPVMRKKKLVGIISRRDLIARGGVRTALLNAVSTPVSDLMEATVVTTRPDEPVNTAAQLLIDHDISRLPVMDGGRIVGILGRHDALAGLPQQGPEG